jgi:DNA modification methylase
MNNHRSNSTRAPGWDRLRAIDVMISELSPAPDHARRHPAAQIRDLARSIETFGFNAPVVIDDESRLLAGHARVEAAKRLGWDSVPAVRVADLTVAEKRAFALADNRLAERATWDEVLLAENFQILDGLDLEFDLDITGFSTTEIDRLLGLDVVDEVDEEGTLATPGTGPSVSRPGDLWELGDHRLLCGDALKAASYATLLGDRCARMVLTDPPYNVRARHIGRTAADVHGDFVAGAGEMDDAGFVDFLATMFGHARQVSVDGALAYVFMDWRHAWHVLEAGRRIFDELKNICVWNKSNGGMGSLYRSKHELVFVFKAGRAAHVNNVDLGCHGRDRTNVWDHAGVNSLGGAIEDATRAETLETHPTVKPVKLLADAILDVSRRGEIVLDPFLGSGSTLIACERVGRVCHGIELDPRYADAALLRWRSYTGEEPVHAATGLSLDRLETQRAATVGVDGTKEVAR